MTDNEMLEARQRSREWREMLEEYCTDGGALLGLDERETGSGVSGGLENVHPHIEEAELSAKRNQLQERSRIL